jgi:hypothetical protein
VEIAIAKLKKYKSPGSDQIPSELIQAGGEILLSAIHKLIDSVWNKEELPDQWKALGFTLVLTEMSTRNIKIMFLGSKVRRVSRADNLTTICEPIV